MLSFFFCYNIFYTLKNCWRMQKWKEIECASEYYTQTYSFLAFNERHYILMCLIIQYKFNETWKRMYIKTQITLRSLKWNPADVAAHCNRCLFPVSLIKLHCPFSSIGISGVLWGTACVNRLRQSNTSLQLSLLPATEGKYKGEMVSPSHHKKKKIAM